MTTDSYYRELRLSGSGGQGLLLSARILSEALLMEGRRVSQSQSYEPTSRGGLSRGDLVVSSGESDYPLVTALDYLVILDHIASEASTALLKPDALVLTDLVRVPNPPKGPFTLRRLPLLQTARGLGNERVANLVAVGVLVGMTGLCGTATVEKAIRRFTPAEFQSINLAAFAAGCALAKEPAAEAAA